MPNLNVELTDEQAKALQQFLNDYLNQAGEIVPTSNTTGNALFSALQIIEDNLIVAENNCLDVNIEQAKAIRIFNNSTHGMVKIDVTSTQSGQLKEEKYYFFPSDPTF